MAHEATIADKDAEIARVEAAAKKHVERSLEDTALQRGANARCAAGWRIFDNVQHLGSCPL